MKKHIILISSILQFVSFVCYMAIIRSGILTYQGKIDFEVLFLIFVLAFISQYFSIRLKNKYKDEVVKAEKIMREPNKVYGFIALGFFCLIVIAFLVYLYITKPDNPQISQNEVSNSQQNEIDSLKKTVEELKNNTNSKDIVPLNNSDKNQQQDLNSISSLELKPLLTGIVEIICGNSQGSGSLMTRYDSIEKKTKYSVLTNKHVISTSYPNGSCRVQVYNKLDSNAPDNFNIYTSKAMSWNSFTDIDILDLYPWGQIGPYSPVVENQNYTIGNLDKCSTSMPINSPTVVIGYPAFTQTSKEINIGGLIGDMRFDSRTVTNGVISAYDISNTSTSFGLGVLPYSNYFVSNTIDHGNSGGIALSKNNGKLCILGVPTWLNQGVSNNQGVVQNIWNIDSTPQ